VYFEEDKSYYVASLSINVLKRKSDLFLGRTGTSVIQYSVKYISTTHTKMRYVLKTGGSPFNLYVQYHMLNS
jgi:hypothetical protein